MGSGKVKVTKMSWYEVNDTKVVLFKDLTKTQARDKEIYYYINEAGERKYVLNSDVKKQFLEKKKSRTINIFLETSVLKFPKAFYLTENGDFEKLEESDVIPAQLYRRFTEKPINNSIYKSKSGTFKREGKNKYYYYEMIESENKLVRNRCKAVKNINQAYGKLVNCIYEEIKINNRADVNIQDNVFNEFYTVLKKFTLDPYFKNTEITRLRDKGSNADIFKILKTVNINSELGNLIINNLQNGVDVGNAFEPFQKSILKSEFEKYFTTKNILINSTLGIGYDEEKTSTSKAKEYEVNNSDVRKNVEKYLKEYNYDNLLNKLKKLFGSNKPIISAYNKEVEVFNIIKAHYKQNYENIKLDFNDSERAYYTKQIHLYILGRACKIRKKALEGKYKTYKDCAYLFDKNTITDKITRKIVNKSMLKDVTKGKIEYYNLENENAEISKQLVNILETFNKKSNPLTYNAIVTGISEYQEYNEIYSAGNAESFDKILDKAINEKYYKARLLNANEIPNKAVYLKGAYFYVIIHYTNNN